MVIFSENTKIMKQLVPLCFLLTFIPMLAQDEANILPRDIQMKTAVLPLAEEDREGALSMATMARDHLSYSEKVLITLFVFVTTLKTRESVYRVTPKNWSLS